ncbi:hypothetical protein [Chamaesiphon sp. VAR_69_metabat_338]|uniref:hypothetical protein n=1 Tax=Chamaesiphon sp. VAR_69_metabat_338 TaxID=2964704 RepID=UPI00286E9167|nr:hypothetical protein [Chamaesiphon sp. VAR_69_metabat_338]
MTDLCRSWRSKNFDRDVGASSSCLTSARTDRWAMPVEQPELARRIDRSPRHRW